ncbi:hypothetical protein C0992_005188, partial [Termitomyces sp. T32_za158]
PSVNPVQRVFEVSFCNDSSLCIPSGLAFTSLEKSIEPIEPIVAQNSEKLTCSSNPFPSAIPPISRSFVFGVSTPEPTSQETERLTAIALPLKRTRPTSIDKTFTRQRDNVGPPIKKIKIDAAEEENTGSGCEISTAAVIQSSLASPGQTADCAKALSLIEKTTEETLPNPEPYSGSATGPSEPLNAGTTPVSQMPAVTSVPVTFITSSRSSKNCQSTTRPIFAPIIAPQISEKLVALSSTTAAFTISPICPRLGDDGLLNSQPALESVSDSTVPTSPITIPISQVHQNSDFSVPSLTSMVCGVTDDTMHLKGNLEGNKANNASQALTAPSSALIHPASSDFPGWGDNDDAMDLEGNTAINASQVLFPCWEGTVVSPSPIDSSSTSSFPRWGDTDEAMDLEGNTETTNTSQVPAAVSPAPIDPAFSGFPGWGG